VVFHNIAEKISLLASFYPSAVVINYNLVIVMSAQTLHRKRQQSKCRDIKVLSTYNPLAFCILMDLQLQLNLLNKLQDAV
jgi:hypothetical protein